MVERFRKKGRGRAGDTKLRVKNERKQGSQIEEYRRILGEN